MKVQFLKDHLDNKAGEIKEIEYARARYFINTNVVKLANGEDGKLVVKKKVKKSTKVLKVNLETK